MAEGRSAPQATGQLSNVTQTHGRDTQGENYKHDRSDDTITFGFGTSHV